MHTQADINKAVQMLGYPAADYSYTPHITLARGEGQAAVIEPFSWITNTIEIRRSGKSQEPHTVFASLKLAN